MRRLRTTSWNSMAAVCPMRWSRIRDPAYGGWLAVLRAGALDGSVVDDFERMWSDLAPVGRSSSSGGYFRQPFTTPERELADWFVGQATARSLRLESDLTGNLVAWWDPGVGVVRDSTAL